MLCDVADKLQVGLSPDLSMPTKGGEANTGKYELSVGSFLMHDCFLVRVIVNVNEEPKDDSDNESVKEKKVA
ncbi:hypothetical protein MKW98_031409, partial [Papaver atlanticum]